LGWQSPPHCYACLYSKKMESRWYMRTSA
jgi:hypothetical protein